ncbi:MAG TPA: hypothetical protein VLG68_01000 [Gammaproteobacteria bacterium]|nr:hypothetical protein [Gammaproteobacteria bacterium]
MAIRLQFISLVIPVATLDKTLRGEGGFTGFLQRNAAWLGEMVWHDGQLCRTEGAMNWSDVDEMVTRWEAYGLQGLVGLGQGQWWKDFAICASGRGPTYPCDWLQYDASDNCVYLTGTPKGAVVGESLRMA